MSTYNPTHAPDSGYIPTEDDIQAYNEDQAKLDGTQSIDCCPDGTLHYWRELTTGERIGYYELATQSELDRARICFKCGAWK